MIEAILGIDISKKDLSLALLSKGTYKKNKLPNTQEGFEELTQWLLSKALIKLRLVWKQQGAMEKSWLIIFTQKAMACILLTLPVGIC